VGASYGNRPRCPSIRLSHANISETKRGRPIWLLGNANRNLGFPIQNLPPASRSEYGSAILGGYCRRTKMADSGGRVEFTGTHVVLAVGKKPRHGETRLGGAYEIGCKMARH